MRPGKGALAVLLGLCVAASMFADKRLESVDVFVALDRSLSMGEGDKIEAVKQYVSATLVDEMLIAGDLFVVIAFYGKADVVVHETIGDEADKAKIRQTIQQLKGDGRFTDIGNALDRLKAEIDVYAQDGRQKYVLLLTDGIQEAPPGSKYYSKDGTFNHDFLANTKVIQQQGWKIHIIGIGTDTAARELARELEGSYDEVAEAVQAGALATSTANLFGTIAVEDGDKTVRVGRDGSAEIQLNLRTSGFQSRPRVSISAISASWPGGDLGQILESPYSFSLEPEGSAPVTIPLRFPAGLAAGTGSSDLTFSFLAGERFSPSRVQVTLIVPRSMASSAAGRALNQAAGWAAGNLLWLIIAGVVILAGAAVLIALAARRARGGLITFTAVSEDTPIREDPVTLPPGRGLFLNESDGVFTLVPRRNARSIARLCATQGRLALDILKPDRFPKLKEPPAEARGETFRIRLEHGQSKYLTIRGAEAARGGAEAARGGAGSPASDAAPRAPRRRAGSPAKRPAARSRERKK